MTAWALPAAIALLPVLCFLGALVWLDSIPALPEYVVLVEPTEVQEAEERFRTWKRDHPEVQEEDLVIDHIRGEGGIGLRRYRVRRGALGRGENL